MKIIILLALLTIELVVSFLRVSISLQLLAVVYDAFSEMEKRKLKKLWLHERKACQLAFKLLVTKQVLYNL